MQQTVFVYYGSLMTCMILRRATVHHPKVISVCRRLSIGLLTPSSLTVRGSLRKSQIQRQKAIRRRAHKTQRMPRMVIKMVPMIRQAQLTRQSTGRLRLKVQRL